MTSDIFVLLPGITGSVLQKDGKDAFGLTASAGLRALFSAGQSISDLRTDLHAAPGVRPDDGVSADRVAPDAHMIPGLWKIDGYTKVAEFLAKRLKAVAGESYFEFPYDWRLDNRVAALELKESIGKWLGKRRLGYPDAKAILVAHSMGGLVSRYYLEVLEGWRDTSVLITFGTPFRGSLNALDYLVNGFTKAYGLVDLSELVGSFPSMYQLLPIYRCVDTGEEEMSYITAVVERIPGLDAEAVRAARSFHQEIQDAVTANKGLGEYAERGYRLREVVGIEHPTQQSAVLGPKGLTVLDSYQGTDLGGDGTVPRVAATPLDDKDDSNAMFAGTRHASLQNADAVLTQLRGWLSGIDLNDFMAGAPVRLSVALDDVYLANQPIVVTVTSSEATAGIAYKLERLSGPGDAFGSGTVSGEPLTGWAPARDARTELDLPAQDPGLFRVTLSGGPEVEPVSDLVVVAPH